MKKSCLILVIFLPLLLSAQTSWVKWWPQPDADLVWPNNIVKTYDGGYAFHWTWVSQPPADWQESRLFKTDSLGNLIWQKRWTAGSNHADLNTLNQMPDSSYFWAGRYIVKVTPDGQIDWAIDVDTLIANGAEIYTSTLTPDGNIVFVALQRDPDFIWWLIKLTTDGNILWIKPYQLHYVPIKIRIFNENRMVAIGQLNFGEIILLKFTPAGDIYSSQIVSHPNIFAISGMIVDSQTNLLLYGSTDWQPSGKSHIFYLDSLGNILWDKYIEFPDTNLKVDGIVSALENCDSSFVMISWGIGAGDIDAILQADKSGNIEWWQQLPGSPGGKEDFVREKDGYVVGLSKGNDKIGIARTDSNGVIAGINKTLDFLPKTVKLYQNHPNPFNARTTITFDLPKTDFVQLTIFNILGEEIEKLINRKMNAGHHQLTWDASHQSSGIYLFKIKTGNKHFITKKMLLVK